MRTDSILKALDIDTDRYPVLSVVGGGGKTSLIFRMMEELTAAGKKVLITTTTHMAYEPDRPFAEDGDMISIKQNLEEYGYTIAASLDREKHKIGALSEEKLKEIKVLADVILIEADGAKRYPLKVPASWEPVIWEQTDLVIAVVGMDAVGRPIREVCHRPECVADFLGKETEEKLTEEDIYHLSKLAIMEYLTSGITANFDMYLTPDAIAEASKDCGFRTVIAGAMNDFTQSPGQLANWYEKYNHDHELISFCLGFHAEYTTSEKLLKEVALLAHNYHAPVYTHNSETVREVEECRARTGMTPTAYLDSLGMFEYGGGGYHGVYLTEEDMDIFKKHDLSVVTNPASNMKLASGIAPIARFMERGINLAIGTDGPARRGASHGNRWRSESDGA